MSRKRNVTVAAVQMKCSTDVEELSLIHISEPTRH